MSEPEFAPHPKAALEVIEERNTPAECVRRELRRAGLPAYRGDLSSDAHGQRGVDVHVEPFIEDGA